MNASTTNWEWQCIAVCRTRLLSTWLTTSSSRMCVMNHHRLVSHETASSSVECGWDKLPFSFVTGQYLTMWYIVWISPQGHRSVSVSRHFLLQALQCPCSVWKRFSRDHCCRGRSKPGCRIVGSHTRWELTTWGDFQLCLHRLLCTSLRYSQPTSVTVSHSTSPDYHVTGSAFSVVGPSLLQVWWMVCYSLPDSLRDPTTTVSDNRWRRICFIVTTQHTQRSGDASWLCAI